MQTYLPSRVIVITGGGTGIGRAIAETFAAGGDQVFIIGRREAPLRETAAAIGPSCAWHSADVSQPEQVAAAVAAALERFGRIDVLVNNAGHAYQLRADMSLAQAEETWQENLQANLTSAFLMTYAAVLHITRPGGRIINISSGAASSGGAGLRTLGYAAAKAGLEGLTRALAKEYSPQGITVNAIAAGFIYGTPANQDVPPDIANAAAEHILVRRLGRVEDIATAAVYLASPQASFITGQVLNVTGG